MTIQTRPILSSEIPIEIPSLPDDPSTSHREGDTMPKVTVETGKFEIVERSKFQASLPKIIESIGKHPLTKADLQKVEALQAKNDQFNARIEAVARDKVAAKIKSERADFIKKKSHAAIEKFELSAKEEIAVADKQRKILKQAQREFLDKEVRPMLTPLVKKLAAYVKDYADEIAEIESKSAAGVGVEFV